MHFFGEAVTTTRDNGEVKASTVDDSKARRIAVVVYLIIPLYSILILLWYCSVAVGMVGDFRLGLDVCVQSAERTSELVSWSFFAIQIWREREERAKSRYLAGK